MNLQHPNTWQLLEVAPYTAANTACYLAATGLKIFVYGSEFKKDLQTTNWTGAAGAHKWILLTSVLTPSFTQFSNSPIIIRNNYTINGSDMAQIGWVEVATEDGTSGYLWYLKAESETRLRFEDYLEMSVVEGEKAAAGSGAAANCWI